MGLHNSNCNCIEIDVCNVSEDAVSFIRLTRCPHSPHHWPLVVWRRGCWTGCLLESLRASVGDSVKNAGVCFLSETDTGSSSEHSMQPETA